MVHRPGVQMAVADFLSRNGGGGGAAGRTPPRPELGGGVCGEGGVVQRGLQWERELGDKR